MAKERQTRKELLKSPDEFMTLSGKVLNYLSQHTREVKIAVIGLAVVFAAYLAVWGYMGYVDKKGQAAYNQAYEIMKENLQPEPDPESVRQAKQLFAELVDDYGMSKAADLALPQMAFLYAREKQYDEAIQTYREFNETVAGKPPYPALSALAIASLYEAKGDYDSAIAALEPILQEKESPFKQSALYQQARLYALAGQTEKSKTLFKAFVDAYPESPFKPMAEAQI